MPKQIRKSGFLVVPLLIFAAGCESRVEIEEPQGKIEEPRFEIMPTYATRESYADQIEFDSMPAATRQLYDALFDGKLAGARAAEFQSLLDTAQRITEREQFILYEFQLTDFDRPYEEVEAEGVPMMGVMVQKKYCLIYKCDVSAPEF